MRRCQLRALGKRLSKLRQRELNLRQLLLKLGEARGRYRAAWRLLDRQLPPAGQKGTPPFSSGSTATNCARHAGAKAVIFCAPICADATGKLWQCYIRLTKIEAAFKNLKDDLALRPIYHQFEPRVEAHIFVAFIAYCLHMFPHTQHVENIALLSKKMPPNQLPL